MNAFIHWMNQFSGYQRKVSNYKIEDPTSTEDKDCKQERI